MKSISEAAEKIDGVTLIQVVIASSLFGLFYFGLATFSSIVVNVLSFIVFLEIVKAISNFITNKDHVIQLRTVIDGFIVFFLRDLALIFSDEKNDLTMKVIKIFIILVIITFLFTFRILSLKYSPSDKKKCDDCPLIH